MDLILLIFFCIHIGRLAERKGLSSRLWRWRLVGIWILFELIGLYAGSLFFGFNMDNLFGLFLFALACAFGGYLLVRKNLENRPDPMDNDINNIGS